jgi:uncharacterized oligopeptide transporter (OPT) family protein
MPKSLKIPTRRKDEPAEARTRVVSRPVRPVEGGPSGPSLPVQDSPVDPIVAAALELGGAAPGPEPESEAPRWFRRLDGESPREVDLRWRREVCRENEAQLTPRAVLTGIGLGAVLAISNLYVGLKAGWALGVAITACMMSAAIWRGLSRAGLARSPISILEQNCMQSTASAAGYTTSAALVTAVPAYMLITGSRISAIWLVLWTVFTSLLGLSLFVGVKRQLLHYERLAWPSSVAAAQTLRSLHERGREAVSQAQWLFGAATIGGLVRFSISNTFSWWKLPAWPESVLLPGSWFGTPLRSLGAGFDASALYLAAGAILGPRVSSWMFAGSALVWLVVTPVLLARGVLEDAGYGSVMMGFAVWTGASLMVAAGVTGLVLELGVLGRGFRSLMRSGGRPSGPDPLDGVEIPATGAWLVGSISVAGILVTGEFALGIAWYFSLFGVLAAVAVCGVAIRAAGETDIIPAGSLGKLVQLGYGIGSPRGVAANLLGTSIVTTSAATAADAAVNLKCGHLLGASPRSQFLAQAIGILAGTAVVVPAFELLVPTVDVLGSAGLPVPAAQAWRFVAEVVSGGLGALGGVARTGIVVGTALGIGLAYGEWRGWDRRWWPSPLGLGIGMVLGLTESASFFLGALVAYGWQRGRGEAGEDRVVAVSAGGIAGDSLMGVFLAILVALGWMAA